MNARLICSVASAIVLVLSGLSGPIALGEEFASYHRAVVARQGTIALPDSLDPYIQRQMRQRRVPGLALAIARNGTILTAKGYGLADAQNDVAMKPDTRFELASITKQFTAAGIMMLVEENKVDLDASVASYLPDIPDAWKAITVRHLLTHTSGLPTLGEDFSGFRTGTVVRRDLDVSTTLMYEAARADTLRFRPGEQYLYSDVGFFLLGMITEKASGVRWREFIKKRIFEPLAMTDSYVQQLHRFTRTRRVATPYGMAS